MKKRTLNLNYFSKFEYALWGGSVCFIISSFLIFDRHNFLTVIASTVGATSLIFCAKGNPFGQFLMLLFSLLYGIISYSFSYYGEMITYLGMTAPMAAFSLISWLKNPYNGNKAEVSVNNISRKESVLMFALATFVTTVFYFILKFFNTANIIPSTLSVATSFIAAYLTFRRSPYLALAYAFNDLILIILWVLATLQSLSYLSVVVCFITFFINDSYCFLSWKRMQKRQAQKL